ncbi:cytochrome b561 domain-containing protein 2 [Aplysia californica]|uniref:ascorbate ferrireductase (transmembrane) n=1 Tax=Aplysia californica TaxID=6500 RepID=A0ABM1W3B5_APLCA|nr:cytochrome b561 domain-containing protein 2 [Aplysia californica]
MTVRRLEPSWCITVFLKMVAHLAAVLFPGIIIYSAVPGSSLFSWHPTLMAIGFVLLMFEGIVVFSKSSSLYPTASRPSKVTVHSYVIGVGVTCAFAGVAAIYVNKDRAGKDHFTTWHGLIGIITMAYCCAQSCGGALAKYYKYVGGFIKVKLADLKLYHATSGLFAYTLVTASFVLGLQSNWAVNNIHWLLWYVCMGCVAASALVVMTHITTTYMPQTQQSRPASSASRKS